MAQNIANPSSADWILQSPNVKARGVGQVVTAALVAGGVAFLAALSQMEMNLPFTPVPITGQTLAVLVLGALYGRKLGVTTLLAYLGVGFLGAPVFAGGVGGIAKLGGPTGGYLIGFVVAAWLVAFFAERGLLRSWTNAILAFLLAHTVIFIFGCTWLSFFVGGLERSVALGFYPFLPGEIVKSVLAVGAVKGVAQLTRG